MLPSQCEFHLINVYSLFLCGKSSCAGTGLREDGSLTRPGVLVPRSSLPVWGGWAFCFLALEKQSILARISKKNFRRRKKCRRRGKGKVELGRRPRQKSHPSNSASLQALPTPRALDFQMPPDLLKPQAIAANREAINWLSRVTQIYTIPTFGWP